MVSLELLQQVRFALLVASHATRFLLSLVVHHLLNHGTRLTVQVAETGVLGLNLGDIDLGRTRHNVGPPLDLVDFVKMNVDFFARRGRGCLEGPGRFVDEDRVGEVALQMAER